jgi:hypothetical protein
MNRIKKNGWKEEVLKEIFKLVNDELSYDLEELLLVKPILA